MRIKIIGIQAVLLLGFGLANTACASQTVQPALLAENKALEFYEFYSPM